MKNTQNFMTPPFSSMTPAWLLRREDQRRIVEQSYQHPNGYLIRFLLHTGLMPEEALQLTFSDVNVQTSELDIPIFVRSLNYPVAFRFIPIHFSHLTELLDWRCQKLQTGGMTAAEVDRLPIASTVDGKPLSLDDLQQIFNNILEACELPCYPLAILRHTYAVRALEGGMKPVRLVSILGDGSLMSMYMCYIAMTETKQAHTMPEPHPKYRRYDDPVCYQQ